MCWRVTTGGTRTRRIMVKKRVAKAKTSPPALSPRMTALSKLTPYKKNPRVIPDTAVKAVAASLKRFGWKQAIVADPKGVIVAGETRYKAAVLLGWTSAPVVTIPARQARAFRVIDNRTSELTSWDHDLLPDELAGLADLDIFSFDDVSPPAATGGKTDPDDIPKAPKPRTKRGDVWTLGDHRLMCGDATKASDVALVLDGATPALIFTSPPHADLRSYKTDVHTQDWTQLLTGAFAHLSEQAAIQAIVNIGPINRNGEVCDYWRDWMNYMRGAGWLYIGHYVWDKGYGKAGSFHGRLPSAHEWLFHFAQSVIKPLKSVQTIAKYRRNKGRAKTVRFREKDGSTSLASSPHTVGQFVKAHDSVFRIAPNLSNADGSRNSHPATFPVALPEEVIPCFVSHGASVYDPFVGSGTTIIAAEREQRRCYAMEIAPEYVDLAVKRWEDFTGQKAQCNRQRHGR